VTNRFGLSAYRCDVQTGRQSREWHHHCLASRTIASDVDGHLRSSAARTEHESSGEKGKAPTRPRADPEDLVPRPHTTDQILVTDWRFTTAESLSKSTLWWARSKSKAAQEKITALSYIVFQAGRLGPDSAAALKSVLHHSCGSGETLSNAPGFTWGVGQWQFSALLALEEFRSLAWLLAQHKEVFPNKVITQVSVFKGQGADDNTPSFIWYLGEMTDDISSRAAAFTYMWAKSEIERKRLNGNWLIADGGMRKFAVQMRNANIHTSAQVAQRFGISEFKYQLGKDPTLPVPAAPQSQVQPRTDSQGLHAPQDDKE